MNEGRAPAQESGIKRQATDTVTTSPKKSKFGTEKTGEEKKAKDQRKQDFQQWMREDDVLWQHYPSCLVYQYKDGKFVKLCLVNCHVRRQRPSSEHTRSIYRSHIGKFVL